MSPTVARKIEISTGGFLLPTYIYSLSVNRHRWKFFLREKKTDDAGCLVLIQQIIAIQLLFKILFHAHKQQYFDVRSVKIVKHPVFTLNIEPLT